MIFTLLPKEYQARFEFLYENRKRPLIISGSGHSLTSIDYSCYPNNPVIVRTNNFFFEEEYYLGKALDYIIVHSRPQDYFHQYFNTVIELLARREYSTSNRYSYGTISKVPEQSFISPFLTEGIYSSITDISLLYSFSSFLHCLLEKDYRPTAGMYALSAMILLGFTEIYLVGIDLYNQEKEGSYYPFNLKNKPNFLKLCPLYDSDSESKNSSQFVPITHTEERIFSSGKHSLYVEKLILEWAQEHASLYSLSKESTFLNTIIPLAPKTNNTFSIKAPKENTCVNDYISLPETMKECDEKPSSLKKLQNSFKKRCSLAHYFIKK